MTGSPLLQRAGGHLLQSCPGPGPELRQHGRSPSQRCSLTGHVSRVRVCPQAAAFHVDMKDVGPLLSLIVDLDGKRPQQAWHCQMVTLENVTTGAITYFACDKYGHLPGLADSAQWACPCAQT